MQTIFPILRYNDARGAMRSLCATFGFVELFSVPESGQIVRHAQLKLGSKLVFSRVLTPVRAGEVKDGVTLARDGIDDYFAGKAPVVWYWESGRRRRLLGWD